MIATMPKEQLVPGLMEFYGEAEARDRTFKDKALTNWKSFKSVLPDAWPYQSNIFVPYTSMDVTTVVEKIMAKLFPKERVFEIDPLSGQGELETELMRELLADRLRSMKYKLLKFYQCFECVLFGNGVQHHTARARTIRVATRVPVTYNDGMQTIIGYTQGTKQSLEVQPFGEVVSRFDCYPGGTGGTIQEMPMFCFRQLVPVDLIKAAAPLAGYDPAVVAKLDAESFAVDASSGTVWANDERKFDMWERLAAVGYDVRQPGGLGATKWATRYLELLTFHDRAPLEEGGESCATIVNRDLVLKAGANPWLHRQKPFSEIKFAPMGHSYWQAMGLPELIEQIQYLANIRANQKNDRIDLDVNPMWLLANNAGVKDKSLIGTAWPGSVIGVDDINGVKPMERPEAISKLFEDDQWMSAIRQRVTQVMARQ